jgi:hypothetical protein
MVGVVIMDAPSLIQAGLKAIRGAGAGATFADGHELTADQVALVPARKIGRMIPADEAERLLAKLEDQREPGAERPRRRPRCSPVSTTPASARCFSWMPMASIHRR